MKRYLMDICNNTSKYAMSSIDSFNIYISKYKDNNIMISDYIDSENDKISTYFPDIIYKNGIYNIKTIKKNNRKIRSYHRPIKTFDNIIKPIQKLSIIIYRSKKR